jgi:hypothetical protein
LWGTPCPQTIAPSPAPFLDPRSRREAEERLGTLEGRVRRIEPAAFTKISTLGVEEQRVNVLLDVTSPHEKWRGLGDAYQVDTRITVFTQEDATIAPAGALFRKGDSWSVFVVVDGRAEARAITLASAIRPACRGLLRSGRWRAGHRVSQRSHRHRSAGRFSIGVPDRRILTYINELTRMATIRFATALG